MTKLEFGLPAVGNPPIHAVSTLVAVASRSDGPYSNADFYFIFQNWSTYLEIWTVRAWSNDPRCDNL